MNTVTGYQLLGAKAVDVYDLAVFRANREVLFLLLWAEAYRDIVDEDGRDDTERLVPVEIRVA